jgi:hypothetical protein
MAENINYANLITKFTADTADIKRGFEEINRRAKASANDFIRSWTNPIKRSISTIFGPAGIAAITAGFGYLIKTTADAVDNIGDLSQTLGVSTDTLQKWSFAAKGLGQDTESIGKIFSSINKNLGGLQNGIGKTGKVFEAMGIDVKEFLGLNADQAILKLSDVTKEFSSTEKTKAFEALGSGLSKLIPLLNEGSDKFRKMNEQYEGLKLGLSAADIQKVGAFQDSIDTLGLIWTDFKQKLTAELAEPLTEWLQSLIETVRQMGGMGGVAKSIKESLVTGAKALKDAGTYVWYHLKETAIRFRAIQFTAQKLAYGGPLDFSKSLDEFAGDTNITATVKGTGGKLKSTLESAPRSFGEPNTDNMDWVLRGGKWVKNDALVSNPGAAIVGNMFTDTKSETFREAFKDITDKSYKTAKALERLGFSAQETKKAFDFVNNLGKQSGQGYLSEIFESMPQAFDEDFTELANTIVKNIQAGRTGDLPGQLARLEGIANASGGLGFKRDKEGNMIYDDNGEAIWEETTNQGMLAAVDELKRAAVDPSVLNNKQQRVKVDISVDKQGILTVVTDSDVFKDKSTDLIEERMAKERRGVRA